MKKMLFLLFILLIAAACNKKLSSIEQDYYTIIHEIVPLQEEFAKKSSEPVYKIKEALEKGENIDIDKAIDDIKKAQEETINIIREKDKKMLTAKGSKYIEIKSEYINMVSFFSIEMLKEFKQSEEKTVQSFTEIIQKVVEKSGRQMNNILEIEEKILEEIKNMVEK